MIRAERRTIRAERADCSGRQSLMLALGSMLVALPVTAIVLKGSPGVAAIMLMALIWVIVGIINVAYAMRKHPGASSRSTPNPKTGASPPTHDRGDDPALTLADQPRPLPAARRERASARL